MLHTCNKNDVAHVTCFVYFSQQALYSIFKAVTFFSPSPGNNEKVPTMAQLLDQVIDVISRQPANRSDVDINAALPWLRRRTELMSQLDQG